MKKIIHIMRWMFNLHRWFISFSPEYLGAKSLGGMRRNDIAYFPFAYVKFMWASFGDCLNSMKIITTLKARGMES